MAEGPHRIEPSRALLRTGSTDRIETQSSVSVPEPSNTLPPLPPGGAKSNQSRPSVPPRVPPCMELSGTSRKGDDGTAGSGSENDTIPEEDRRVTVWNPTTGKKLSGNASPFRRNLHKYLAAHPDWEECPDAGETKKRRKSSSSSQVTKRSKLDDCDIGGCPLYLWDCLVAVAHAHSKNEEEWKGPIENIPSPSTPVTIPCRFTLSTAG